MLWVTAVVRTCIIHRCGLRWNSERSLTLLNLEWLPILKRIHSRSFLRREYVGSLLWNCRLFWLRWRRILPSKVGGSLLIPSIWRSAWFLLRCAEESVRGAESVPSRIHLHVRARRHQWTWDVARRGRRCPSTHYQGADGEAANTSGQWSLRRVLQLEHHEYILPFSANKFQDGDGGTRSHSDSKPNVKALRPIVSFDSFSCVRRANPQIRPFQILVQPTTQKEVWHGAKSNRKRKCSPRRLSTWLRCIFRFWCPYRVEVYRVVF